MPRAIKELKALADNELNVRLTDIKKELVNLNGQVATGTPPKNPMQIRNLKRSIAVIKTLLNQRRLNKSIKKIKEDKQS